MTEDKAIRSVQIDSLAPHSYVNIVFTASMLKASMLVALSKLYDDDFHCDFEISYSTSFEDNPDYYCHLWFGMGLVVDPFEQSGGACEPAMHIREIKGSCISRQDVIELVIAALESSEQWFVSDFDELLEELEFGDALEWL